MSAALPFPSVAWFARLGEMMSANSTRQIQLGTVDCVARFTVLKGGNDGSDWSADVSFEEYGVADVREPRPGEAARADFALEADLPTWREMIENIAAGKGRPDLEHTLNRLSHTGAPFFLRSDDVLRADMYFRFNQSLQEFVNASAQFETRFPARK
ncbi:MAG TPA: hypothetical protein VMR50_15020 [Myxococcota bacterium]|nr:hypothetical protein [Myxococcota bacterium]